MGRALACAAVGLLFSYLGYRLIKRHEKPVETPGFHTVHWPSLLGYGGGYALLFLGLMLLMVFTPMFWLGRPR